MSCDAAGAFDCAPHHSLVHALEKFGVGAHEGRALHNWLRNRTFRVKLRARGGEYKSSIHKITPGLLQGGVLLPLLWLLFCDGVVKELAARWNEMGAAATDIRSFYYADDITTGVRGDTEEELRRQAFLRFRHVQEALSAHGLTLNIG